MDKIEKLIRDKAIYSPSGYKEIDTQELLTHFEAERKYGGQLSRVYVIKNAPWVIKEARWDIKLELAKGGIPLPLKITERVMKLFSFTFLPDKEEILNQYKLYLEFAQYMGYFKDDATYYHPNRDLMFLSQKNIRNSLLFFKPEIEKEFDFKISSRIDEILTSDIKYHNFLPKEYLLVGKSISKENKGKITSLMFQEFIKGKQLYEVSDKEMKLEHKKQLILMIYLILLMQMQIKTLPDTRPRYNFLQAYNWLTKTDNVIVAKEGLRFVDTRWFWDTDGNLIKRGLFIPNLVIQKAKTSLNALLKGI